MLMLFCMENAHEMRRTLREVLGVLLPTFQNSLARAPIVVAMRQ